MAPRPGQPLTAEDRALVRLAQKALRSGYREHRHGVAAAVRTVSGTVYVGLNVDGIHGPCAEHVAIGAAVTAGDPKLRSMVAVAKRGTAYPVLSPCGNCRQLLLDYAPDATVIARYPNGRVVRLSVQESLPAAFRTFRAARRTRRGTRSRARRAKTLSTRPSPGRPR